LAGGVPPAWALSGRAIAETGRHDPNLYPNPTLYIPYCRAAQSLDLDDTKTITLEELAEGLRKQGSSVAQKELEVP